jgi:hypothetical protein
LNKDDLEHKLLSGRPIYIGNIPTYRITLGDMAEFGFSKIHNIVSLLCMDDEQAKSYINHDESNTFFFIVLNYLNELNHIQEKPEDGKDILFLLIPHFLSLLFHMEFEFDPECGFKSDGYIISEHNYNELRQLLKERFCLVDIDELEENPDNEIVKKMLEKRRKLREKVKKAKQSDPDNESGINMSDLISIFAQAEHMSLSDVYDNYDIYQFNNQFNRLRIMSDYDCNIQILCAGGEKVKVQHWLTKINNHND